MILSTAAFLTLLGFVAWILGTVWNYQGIAAIGAVLIVGVGAAAMIDGLETQTGEQRVEDPEANTTSIDYQYSQIGTSTSFPTGMLVTLLGGAMTMRTINPDSTY